MSVLTSRSGSFPHGMGSDGRVAAIGDVHGYLDRLQAAVSAIPDKHRTKLVLLGDYIDRGPDSIGTLQYIGDLERQGVFAEMIILPGNHDGMAWRAIAKNELFDMRAWQDNGGYFTLKRCDFDPWNLICAYPDQLSRRLDGHLPSFAQDGDLLFVHAGITPGYDPKSFLEQPYVTPLSGGGHLNWAWTRHEFLEHEGPHIGPEGGPVIVVHGHTRTGAKNAEEAPDLSLRFDRSRIALDGSGSGMMPVLIAEGTDYELLITAPMIEPVFMPEPPYG